MAEFNVLAYHQLDPGVILAPERYDPRRQAEMIAGFPLFSAAEIINEQAQPKARHETLCVVLDTGDAREGVIRCKGNSIGFDELGSAKKVLRTGDVIISRLRPYLRQVALVDEILSPEPDTPFLLLCSTEFFVLRSRDEQSIAFLVPFLLSTPVQKMLAASQEGGHHPRFNQNALKQLMLSPAFLEQRTATSEQVIQAVQHVRQSEALINQAVRFAQDSLIKQLAATA